MNGIFFGIVLISFVIAGFRHVTWVAAEAGAKAPMDALGMAMLDSAQGAVTLAIGLVGAMTLFLGLMKVAEAGGLLVVIARVVRPLMRHIFPEVPPGHPAMGAMMLNFSANVLGLGNAATPFGIRAMQELDRLNPRKGTATNAMAMFLAINTSSITLLPTGVVALRAAAGSANPAGIVPTTLFATIFATAVAILSARLAQRWWPETDGPDPSAGPGAGLPEDALDNSTVDTLPVTAEEIGEGYPGWVAGLVLAGILAIIPLTIFFGHAIAPWIVPGLMVVLLGFGAARRVRVYEVFIEGARDGFQVALRIIPYLVAILVAVGMFRASGAMEILIQPLGILTDPIGLPVEGVTMGLLRSLSGSGAFGFLASVINDPAIGPDSYTGYLVSTIQGSTETTFYVLAVYFGAVQVRRMRHTLVAALIADAASIVGSVVICRLLYGA